MNTTMQRIGRRLGRALVAAGLLCGSAFAQADAVTEWNAVMEKTVAQVPDQEEAARQGRRVGNYILRRLLRPVHGHDTAALVPLVAGGIQ